MIRVVFLALLGLHLFWGCNHSRDNLFDPGNPDYVDFVAPDGDDGMTVAGVGPESLTLVWKDVNNREKGYIVYKGTDSTVLQQVVTLPPGTARWKDSALSPFSTYYYRLAAIDPFGDTLRCKTFVQVRTRYHTPLNIPAGDDIAPPSTFKIGRTGVNTVRLSWSPPSMNHFKTLLLRGLKPDSLLFRDTLPSGQTTWDDVLLERNHYYAIAYFDTTRRSRSTAAWISPLVSPSNLTVNFTEANRSVACSWMGTSFTSDSVLVERSTATDTSWSPRARLAPGTPVFFDTALYTYENFRYRVSSFSDNVYSSSSNIASQFIGAYFPTRKDSTTLFLCRFDEQSGDTVRDEASTKKVLLGGAELANGKFGKALHAGTGQGGGAVIGQLQYPGHTVMVDFWIKPSVELNSATDRMGLLDARPGPFRIYYYSGKLIVDWKDSTLKNHSHWKDLTFPKEAWSHIVIVLNNGKSSLFINDTLLMSVTGFNFSLARTQDSLQIGRSKFESVDPYNYRCFNGLIDDVSIRSQPTRFFDRK